MHRSRLRPSALAVVLASALLSDAGAAYELGRVRVSSGGGVAHGGAYALVATIAQPDASPPMTGGDYALTGGVLRTREPATDPIFADAFE